MKNILFIQGGGGKADHEEDAKLVSSLKESLGDAFKIHYPLLENDSTPDFGRMRQIDDAINLISGDLILVGHSLGASMILKFLTEHDIKNIIIAVFLAAAPFWSGNEDWVQSLKLKQDFAVHFPADTPVYFYHCLDDDEIPIKHFYQYQEMMPFAKTCEIASGGHQFGDDLSMVADDILFICSAND